MNPWVNLTSCIGRLSHAGQVRFDVNCEDCASFVVSFANAVGCHLWASSMGLDFKLSPIVPIGYENAVVGVEFNFHEVAWDGACGDADFVYDAALRYDGDDNPGVFPIVPVIPVRIEFCDGVIGAPFDYRERLTLPGPEGYGNCRARHSEKVRRLLR